MAQKCGLKSCYYGNGCLPLIMIIEANMVAAISMVIWIDPNYFVKGIINNKQIGQWEFEDVRLRAIVLSHNKSVKCQR